MIRYFKFFKGTPPPKWKSFGGLMHPIETISTDFIKHLMKRSVTDWTSLPNQNDGRTQTEWYIIFDNELKRRYENI
jgi:hypothetical protein